MMFPDGYQSAVALKKIQDREREILERNRKFNEWKRAMNRFKGYRSKGINQRGMTNAR